MAFNVSLNLNKSNQIAGLALANVEALAVAGGEGSTDKGIYTTKKVTTYFYDENGLLIRTEEHNEPCCNDGNFTCTAPKCSDPVE